MYVILSDSTNEAFDIYNAIQVLGSYSSRYEAIRAAERFFSKMIDSYHDGAFDRSNAVPVSTENYDQFTGAEIEPYPKHVVGEAIGDGKRYHIYFMVVHCSYNA